MTDDNPWGLAVDHVSVVVADTRAALEFYRDTLGLPTDPSRPDLGYPGAWLQVGGHQIHLLEVANPDPVSGRPAHGGRDRHLALKVADLEGLCRALEAGGYPFTRSRSGRAAVFTRDPDGNGVELIQG